MTRALIYFSLSFCFCVFINSVFVSYFHRLSGELVHLFSQETQSSLQLYWAFSWSLEAMMTSVGNSGEEITELLLNGLLVICWPSMHTGEGAAMLNGIASLLGVFWVLPFHFYCKHTIFTETCWRIKSIFSFRKAWLISHLPVVCFLWCPADFKYLCVFPVQFLFSDQYAMLNIF